MTRTHVDEGELVELQRKALESFTELDEIRACLKESIAELQEIFADVEYSCSRAKAVSDQVDALTDFVRHSRMIDEVEK